ncbi:MAG TPA: Crp/Fnr family transcriptional regulator, partial [Bacteroidia bacterium]|nr:Crp/Fnr family transcriptional regulator [Bacteroidia bacterium]
MRSSFMGKDNLILFIQQVLPMSPARAEQVVAKFKFANFEKNAFILREGTICNASYYIENGVMRSYTYDLEGNE